MIYAEYRRDSESVTCVCRPETWLERAKLCWHTLRTPNRCRRMGKGYWLIGMKPTWFDANTKPITKED